jgi:O-antigen/teichoic acid export membrane protein
MGTTASPVKRVLARVRFGRDESEAFLSGIAIQAMLLITGVLAARILGAEGRGQQALIWIVALTSVQVGMFGLPLSLTYHSATDGSEPLHLLRHVRPIVLTQMTSIVLVYTVVVFLVLSSRIPVVPALVTLAALPAMVTQACGLAIVQGKHEFRSFHVLRCLPPALFAAGPLVGVIAGGRSLTMVMSLWTGSYVLSALATSLYLRRRWKIGPAAELRQLPELRHLVRFGASGFLGSSSPSETFRVDQLLVGVFLSTTDLGFYVTALAFCNLPRFLAQGLGLVAYPKVAAVRGYLEKRHLIRRYVVIGSIVSGAVCLVLALAAGPLITLLFGSDFADATEITQILLVATVLLCVRRVLSDAMRGAGAPGAGSVAELASLISLAPAALLLVPPFGLIGFGWAMTVSYAVGLLALAFSMLRMDREQRRTGAEAADEE